MSFNGYLGEKHLRSGEPMPHTLAIDGGFLARCAFEGRAGLPDGALAKVADLRSQYDPQVTVVAWEGGHLKRQEWFPSYKQKRREKHERWERAEEWREALAATKDALRGSGVLQASAVGWEADDVLYSIARCWTRTKLIWSPDKDLLQAVDDETTIVRPLPGGAKTVKKGDVDPQQELDVQCLMGDPGDGVPGLDGIGRVWARRMVEAIPEFVRRLLFCDVELLAEEVDTFDGALRKKLQYALGHRYDVEATYKLVKLYCVDFEISGMEAA